MKRKVMDTSKAAYDSLRGEEIRKTYTGIIKALKVLGKANFEGIATQMGVQPGVVWRRLDEMRKLELIYRPGTKSQLSSKRNGYEWALIGDTFPKSAPVEKAMKGKSVAEFSKRINTIRQASLF